MFILLSLFIVGASYALTELQLGFRSGSGD